MAKVENIDSNVIENMAGLGFQPTAHWEILTPYYNLVVKYNLTDTHGFQFRARFASKAARENNPNI